MIFLFLQDNFIIIKTYFWSFRVVKDFLLCGVALLLCLCFSTAWAEEYLVGPGN